jgi:hypothetical protein
MSGQAFQFSPSGVRPLELEAQTAPDVIPAAEAIRMLKAGAPAQAPSPPAQSKPQQPAAPAKRRGFVAELRAQLREIEREIRAKKNLEAQASELRRLIAAAKTSPPAVVRQLSSARKTS